MEVCVMSSCFLFIKLLGFGFGQWENVFMKSSAYLTEVKGF